MLTSWHNLLTASPIILPFIAAKQNPWEVVDDLADFLITLIKEPSGIFIHPEAIVEEGAKIKPPAYISQGSLISWTSLIRGGVFIDEGSIIGPGCEVKQSIIGPKSTLAHFNYVGNSLIGGEVNLAAGVVIANYKNEFANKEIYWEYQGQSVVIPVQKFGAVIGDRVKIGSNSVVAPGKVLLRDQSFGALKYIS